MFLPSHRFSGVFAFTKTLGICLAVASYSSTAASQGARLEEVVVTAQKRTESIQDVPVAVSVISESMINRDRLNDLVDITRVSSSLELNSVSAGQANGGARIRGIGTNTPAANLTALGSVAIVVDDVPQGNVSFPQIFDVQQIEVLRGPQGTLFGSTASAGVLSVTSVEPELGEVSGYIGGQYSNKGGLGSEIGRPTFRTALNVPLTENSALRLAVMNVKDIGLQKNVWLNRDDVYNKTSIRAYYLNNLSDKVTLRLIGESHENDKSALDFYAPATTPEVQASADLWEACGVTIDGSAEEYCSEVQPEQLVKSSSLSAIVDWDMGSHSLRSITSYREKEWEKYYRLYNGQVGEALPTDQNFADLGDQFSQEFRLSSQENESFNYIAGIYYSKFNASQAPLIDAPFGDMTRPIGLSVCAVDGTPCPVLPSVRVQQAEVTSQAIYADGNYDFSDSLNIFFGLRYTDHDVFSEYGENGPPTNSAGLNNTNVSGRLGIRWNASDDSMYYASVSRGFKGGIVEITANPGIDPVILEPEIPLSYEVGTKLTMLDRFFFNASVFYTDHDNFHTRRTRESSITGQLVITSENVPSLTGKGFELELIGNLTEQMSVNIGYTYSQLQYPDGYLGEDGISLAGRQFLFAPEKKFVLSGEYRIPMGDGNEVFLGANSYWKSDVLMLERGDPKWVDPAHWAYGGSIGYRAEDGQWSVALYGNNLGAERAPAGMFIEQFRGGLDGAVRIWPVASLTRREVGLSFNYNF